MLLLLALGSIVGTLSSGEICLLELKDGYKLDSTTLDPAHVRELGILNLQIFECYHEIADQLATQPEAAESLKAEYLRHLRSQASVQNIYLNYVLPSTPLLRVLATAPLKDPSSPTHLREINLFRGNSSALNHPDITGRRIKVSLLNSGLSRTCSVVILNKEYSINFNGLNASLFTEDLPGTVAATLTLARAYEGTSGVARNAQAVERTVFRPRMIESDESSGLVASGEYEVSFIDILEGYSIKETGVRFMNIFACMYELPFAAYLRSKEAAAIPLLPFLKESMATYNKKGACSGDFIPVYSTGLGTEDVSLLNYLHSSMAVYVQSTVHPAWSKDSEVGTQTYPGARTGSNILFSSPAGTEDSPLQAHGFRDCMGPIAYGPGSALAVGIGALTLLADSFAALGYQMSFSDLVNVMAETARYTENNNSASYIGGANEWKRNAAGYLFSNTYGFGIVDVNASISYIKALRHIYNTTYDYMERAGWEERLGSRNKKLLGCTGILSATSDGCEECGFYRVSVGRYVPDRVTLQKKVTVARNRRIEKIGIRLKVSDDSNLGELSIVVQSPEGTRGTLIKQGSVTTERIDELFFYSYLFYGENSSGDWIISLLDVGYQYTVFVEHIDLAIFGIESYLSIHWPDSLTISDGRDNETRTVMDRLLHGLWFRRSAPSASTLSYVCTDVVTKEEYRLVYLNGTETSQRMMPPGEFTLARGIKFDCTGPKTNGKEFSLAIIGEHLQEDFSGQGRLMFIPDEVTDIDRTPFRGDIFISGGMHLTYKRADVEEEAPGADDGVASGTKRRAHLFAGTVTGFCVLVVALFGGAFRT